MESENKIFVFGQPDVLGLFESNFSVSETAKLGDAPKCPICGGYVGMIPVLPPGPVDLELHGRLWGDFVFGAGNEILISARALSLFSRSRLGPIGKIDQLSIGEVTAPQSKRFDPPDYFLCTIGSSDYVIDETRSDISYSQKWTCEACRIGDISSIKRLYIELSDRPVTSELFFIRGLPGVVFASSTFKKFCDENNITGGNFTPVSDFVLYFGLRPK